LVVVDVEKVARMVVDVDTAVEKVAHMVAAVGKLRDVEEERTLEMDLAVNGANYTLAD